MGTPTTKDSNIITELKAVLGTFKAEIQVNNEKINEKLDQIQESLNPLKQEVKSLSSKVEIQDRNSRRKNLIIYNLEDNNKETPDILENQITNLITQNLQVTDFTKLELDFVRRMGQPKKAADKPRPVIIGLTTERRKQEILRKCNLLKNTNISVQQDLTIEARTQRKVLVNKMKEEKNKGNDVVIRRNKLVVRGKMDEDHSGQGIGNNKRALSESPEIQTDVNTNKRPQLLLSSMDQTPPSSTLPQGK